MDISFYCMRCGQHVVIAEAGAGITVQCPKCGDSLSVPKAAGFTARSFIKEPLPPMHPVPTAVPPLPPVVPQEEVWFGAKNSIVEIRLGSGALLKIKAVKLYNERELMELNANKATAMHLLQGGGDGSISGVIGSPSWVLIAGTLQNLAMTHVANKNAAKGAAMATTIIAQEQWLREHAGFFPVGRIQGIVQPSPEIWRAQITSTPFVHNGDEFVLVKDLDDSICSIRWNAVEYYNYQTKAL